MPKRTPEQMQEYSTRRYQKKGDCTLFSNLKNKEFFWSTDHLQHRDSHIALSEDWCPISFGLPIRVSPRPSVPNGLVVTLEEYISVFHPGETEVPNPDPLFQPSWRASPEIK
jgi:hypothetical protein